MRFWNAPQILGAKPLFEATMANASIWWSVNSGWANGLVPFGNKPLPEPVLTQSYVTSWSH